MNISAGATADASMEANIGKLLQMLKTAGPDRPEATKDDNADDIENNAGIGNNFSQILRQKISALLQSGESESSQEKTTKGEISKALEKLLKGDQAAAGELLSGLVLLGIVGNKENPVDATSESAEASLHSSKELNYMGGTRIFKEGWDGSTESSKEKNYIGGSPIFNEGWGIPTDSGKERNYVGGSSTFKEGGGLPVNAAPGNGEDLSGTLTAGSSLLRNISGPGDFAGADIDRAAGKADTKGMSSAEKVSGENQSTIVNTSSTVLVQENKARVNNANEIRIAMEGNASEDDQKNAPALKSIQDLSSNRHPDVLKMTDIEGKAKTPQLEDKQTSMSLNEIQNNIAGKVAASTPEFAGMMDKIKADLKSKTAPGDHILEINSANSFTVSGDNSAKMSVNNVSPSQIISHVTDAFNEVLSAEGGRMKITLAPPSLGTLAMDVMVHNNTVKVMLIADNKDVQQMLSGNLDSLKGSLQSQGLTIESCDVMMQDRREQYPQGFNQQAFNQDRSGGNNDNRGTNYDGEIISAGPLTAIVSELRYIASGVDTISLFV